MGDYFHQTGEQVKVWIGDQSDKTLARNIIAASEPGRIDVIVDDASHITQKMEESLVNFWPALAAGGLYFVEDMYGFTEIPVNSPSEHQLEGVLAAIYNRARVVVLPTADSSRSPGRDIDMIECQCNLCLLR